MAPLAGGDATLYAALAAILGLLVGGIYVAAWAVRLEWAADYFSPAVLVGYLHGIAVALIIGQLSKLTGVSTPAEDPLVQLWQFLSHLNQVSLTTLAVGLASIAGLVVLKRTMPKVPGALVVVVLGIAASAVFDLKTLKGATSRSVPDRD